MEVLGITEEERQDLVASLDFLRGKLDLLVDQFYKNFLETKAGVLFKNTDMDRQQMMFHNSIGVIIAHIEYPEMLQLHLNQTITKHSHYGVTPQYVDDFISAFYKSLKEIFPDDVDKHKVEIWYKLINSVMLYFKKELH